MLYILAISSFVLFASIMIVFRFLFRKKTTGEIDVVDNKEKKHKINFDFVLLRKIIACIAGGVFLVRYMSFRELQLMAKYETKYTFAIICFLKPPLDFQKVLRLVF